MSVQPGSHSPLLTDTEKERIHACVLRILEEIGLQVENNEILDKLAEFGARVDRAAQVVRFPRALVEQFLRSAERVSNADRGEPVRCGVGIFMGQYLDPSTDGFEDWSEKRLADYVKVAKALPHIGGVSILGCPVPAPGEIHPLYGKYLCWKLDIAIDRSIHDLALCPFIEEFHAIRAEKLGIPIAESIQGCMFLLSPLKFGHTDAEQFLYFAKRGYPCSVSNMTTLGGSGPVTLPGTVAQHIAEDVFCAILQRLYYGTKKLSFLCSILPWDMRRAIFCYGRPEVVLGNIMHRQMAEFYGAEHDGPTGLADAKRPGSEAAAQKMLTAMPELMYFGQTSLSAGLLSGDEVYSPIQMIIDDEMAGALKRLARHDVVDDETLAFDAIREAGYGGMFTATEHTVRHFREALWLPALWSHSRLGQWLADGGQSMETRARKVWDEIMQRPDPKPGMDEETEAKVKALMDRALRAMRSR